MRLKKVNAKKKIKIRTSFNRLGHVMTTSDLLAEETVEYSEETKVPGGNRRPLQVFYMLSNMH